MEYFNTSNPSITHPLIGIQYRWETMVNTYKWIRDWTSSRISGSTRKED